VLEGGAIHSDGQGTILVTESCLLSAGRNPHMTKEEIEKTLLESLGAEKVIWLPYGIYQDETNEHVDNVAAFVGPAEIVLAWTDDQDDPQYAMSAADLALLEKEVSWPVDYNGNPMLFFIGLPANLLNKKLDINLYCNIFITYDHEDDQHIYDLSDKNLEPNKSSCVILSDIRSSKVKKISCIEPSKKILISESDDEVPYWLQDPIQKSNMSFQFQIYAGEIDNMFQQDFGDEFYYFFCNESCSEGNVFVQIT